MAKKKKKKTAGKKVPALKPPSKRSCACLQVYFGQLDQHPEFRRNQSQIESYTAYCMRRGEAAFRAAIPTIPIVVHIVHRTASENISDAQIKSQIDVLNKDFRAKNTDAKKVPKPFKNRVGDARSQFELATVDPNGNPTNGITRTETDQSSFGPDDGIKSSLTGGIEPWNTAKFLNIWVCQLSGGLLGYAQFPGGPPGTDGVVILNTAFGTKGTAAAPFNKGRTTTHEIGHYLNLSHIWGEDRFSSCTDSDYVEDTPNQFGPNTGKPSFPSISCDNDPDGDMFMNYMDYVDDAAMVMFSKSQVARMQAALTGPRSQLGS